MGPWVDNLVATTRDSMERGLAAPKALVRRVVAELDDLHAAGVLTDAEFETKRAAVLGAAQSGPNRATSTVPDERDQSSSSATR
jgi:hypothetical protein